MDLPGSGDDSIADLLEEDPRGTFIALRLVFQELDQDEANDGILFIAGRIAREENVNLFRAMREHPDHSREVFGLDPSAIDDDLVAKIDAVMD